MVNYEDYLEQLEKGKKFIKNERIWNIFKNYDTKGVGYLNYEQITNAFKESYPGVFFSFIQYDPEKMKEVLKTFQLNNKNIINFQDFNGIWEKWDAISKQR